jgi:hypothetical protein
MLAFMGRERWEVVWQGTTEIDAEMTAGLLRSAGLRALVEGSHTPFRAATFPLGGTWRVRVPVGEMEAARAVLLEAGEERNLVSAEAEEQKGWLSGDQRATLVAAAVGLAVLAIVIIFLSIREAG